MPYLGTWYSGRKVSANPSIRESTADPRERRDGHGDPSPEGGKGQ